MIRCHIYTLLALLTLGIATAQADALSEARAAAVARGDWDAVERSYQTPQQRLQEKQEKAYEKLCKFQFFKHGDEVGRDLALAAKQECVTNMAMQQIDPAYAPKQDAYNRWQNYFASERGARDRAVDRAVYQQQQMMNSRGMREMNRNLEGIKDRQDTLNRCLLRGYGCY